MDCSHDTALRWLERFEEANILTLHSTAGVKMYSLDDQFAEIRQQDGRRDYKTDDELVDTAAELVRIAERL